MVNQPKPPSRGIITQTPAQAFGEFKVKLIRRARAKFMIRIASGIPPDEYMVRRHELSTVFDAYTRGFGECANLWYKCLKDMDCCLPKTKRHN